MTASIVNRELFLKNLHSARPALSAKDIIAQSSCLVFRKGEVFSYNDEMFCRGPSGLGKEISGAVRAQKLLDIVGKMPEEEIGIEATDSHMVVRGKGRRAGICMEKDILLPVDQVERPEEWAALHADFANAVNVVHQCASTDQSDFRYTCVHVHPKWLESCDRFQICRWRLRTGVKEPTLIRSTSIKHIVSLGMAEFSETASWLHFRNSDGLVLSCRRFVEDFPSDELTKILEGEAGAKTALPKSLAEAVDKAEIFTSEVKEDNHVRVTLSPGKVRIKGVGISGWYSETRKASYSGPPMEFLISPKILARIVTDCSECEITADKLRVVPGKYTYVASLSTPTEEGGSDNGTAEQKEE